MLEFLQHLPHLPPVAASLITIVGTVVAVARLLTASKAFWWALPDYVQKGLPTLLVALGALPAALERATTWLEVALAFISVASTWFLASRGDKRPSPPPNAPPSIPPASTEVRDHIVFPQDDDGRPLELKRLTWLDHALRLTQVATAAFVLTVGVCWLGGCSSVPNPKHPDPACSDEAFAALTAECAAKAAGCVAKGGTEEACGTVCDAASDEWSNRCQ